MSIINMQMTTSDFYDIQEVNEGETVALHLFYKDTDGKEHEVLITALNEDSNEH